jgi:8-oxo-dGTP pyrophosphatase MutT (NUDIX family)
MGADTWPAEPRVVPVARLELAFAPKPWPFAHARRPDIDAHFAAMARGNPTLWNGRVLLMHSHALDGDVFRGAYLETDFASLLAWRDWGFPDPDMRNSYGMAAVRAADGAFLLGVMNAHTANAGRVYFPCGTPDPHDVDGAAVDLEASLRRELTEETGLDAGEFEPQPGWHTVFAGPRIAQIKILQARTDAAELARRVEAFLRQQGRPELAGIRMVRAEADLDTSMPDFVTAFLRHVWRGAQP